MSAVLPNSLWRSCENEFDSNIEDIIKEVISQYNEAIKDNHFLSAYQEEAIDDANIEQALRYNIGLLLNEGISLVSLDFSGIFSASLVNRSLISHFTEIFSACVSKIEVATEKELFSKVIDINLSFNNCIFSHRNPPHLDLFKKLESLDVSYNLSHTPKGNFLQKISPGYPYFLIQFPKNLETLVWHSKHILSAPTFKAELARSYKHKMDVYSPGEIKSLIVRMYDDEFLLSPSNYQTYINHEQQIIDNTLIQLNKYSDTSFFSAIIHPNRRHFDQVRVLLKAKNLSSSELVKGLRDIRHQETYCNNWNPKGKLAQILDQLENEVTPVEPSMQRIKKAVM